MTGVRRRGARAFSPLALTGVLLASPLSAQRPASAGIQRPSARVTNAASQDTATSEEHSGGYVVVRDAAIGAAAGALTGALYASIIVHRPTVTDHSEDQLAYILFSVFGGLAGLLVGAFVGILQTR